MEVFEESRNLQLYIDGFLMILRLTVTSAVLSLVLGTVLATMRVSPIPVLRGFGTAWVNIFRNTPLTLVIIFCSSGLFLNLSISPVNIFNALPGFIGDALSLIGLPTDPQNLIARNFWLGVTGLSAYTSAFVCEAIRAGINTVPVGQAEAARALGLTFLQTLWIVVLPQAGRAVIAPLGSILIALCKNSTIAGVIGVTEAAFAMRTLLNANGDHVLAIFLVFAGTFAAVLIPVGYLFDWLARRLAVKR